MAWQRLALVVEGPLAEALAGALEAHGAISVEWTDADAGTSAECSLFDEPGARGGAWPRARVSALFPANRDPSAALAAALADTGTAALSAASLDRLEDTDWVRETQRQFQPTAVGERLWIVPSWHEPPGDGAATIVLDPGAAFGTGSHPTTRLMLRWLERRVEPGDSVLDYGCGSGILAIAALKLGAREATAVDIDPLALEAARYNAARNAVALRISSADRSPGGLHRITVANILAHPLRLLAPILVRHTRPGGWLALSGILESQAAEVMSAYAGDCTLGIEETDEGWVLLAGRRRPPC